MEWVAEIYRVAGREMDAPWGKRCGVADEGGYWPAFASNEEAIETLVRVIEKAGFDTGSQVAVSLDIAATQIYREGGYFLKREGRSTEYRSVVQAAMLDLAAALPHPDD